MEKNGGCLRTQCPVQRPDDGKVDRLIRNGLLLGMTSWTARWGAFSSIRPQMLWTSNSTCPSACEAFVAKAWIDSRPLPAIEARSDTGDTAKMRNLTVVNSIGWRVEIDILLLPSSQTTSAHR